MPAEWYKEQPKNRNFLTPTGFKFKLELFNGVDFFCQSVNFPDISMPITPVATGLRSVPLIPGGGVEYGDLIVSFIIDEDLENYNSINSWIKKFGLSESRLVPGESDLYSSGRLFIMTSHNNTNHVIEFTNLFPISLSGIPFDATVGDVEYLLADVTFKYERYDILDEKFRSLK